MTEGIETPTCEVVQRWPKMRDESDIVFCGKVAVRRYAASGGGWMYLCLEHATPHYRHSEPCYSGEPS